MDKSQHLRVRDVRAVYRLIGECRELGGDADEWRTHLAGVLCRMTAAQTCPCAWSPGRFREWVAGTATWHHFAGLVWATETAARRWADFTHRSLQTHDPFIREFARLPGRLKTSGPDRLLRAREWLTSDIYNDYIAGVGMGPLAFSVAVLPGRGFQGITIMRPVGDPPFSEREHKLLQFFHGELAPLVGTALSPVPGPGTLDLAPRLQQTLYCLLDGDSEKQAALRLGISRPTLHQYVTALYRHFRVASRGELMAAFLRRFRSGAPGHDPGAGQASKRPGGGRRS